MTAAILHLGGQRIMLDPNGAAFLPASATMVVADLHLEKGTACAVRGHLVPPWDTRLTLDRLALLLRHWGPRRVVALGDSFHDTGGVGRLASADATRLAAMAASVPFVWVQGNHDPHPSGLPGVATAEWEADGLIFRHQARPGARGELCGHHHPKATVATRAGSITRPCFVTDARRLMLPALGAYTGGLDVASPAIARLFPRGGRAFLLGRDRLFSFTLNQVGTEPASPGSAQAL